MENTQDYFGLKELRSVVIRAREKIKIGSRSFDEGEPILYFEKIQISNLKEGNRIVAARGGFGNYPRVIWQNFNDLTFTMAEGVLSKTSFGVLSNTGAIEKGETSADVIKVPKREEVEVQNNKAILLEKPLVEKLFVYLTNDDGVITERIKDFSVNNKNIVFNKDYNDKKIIVDYYFSYEKKYSQYILGDKRIDGLLTLEGKAYFQDDKYGTKKTFLFEIPKMKITSNLDVIMGEKASPTVSVFNIIGLPIKENGQWVVAKMNLLETDIDSDI